MKKTNLKQLQKSMKENNLKFEKLNNWDINELLDLSHPQSKNEDPKINGLYQLKKLSNFYYLTEKKTVTNTFSDNVDITHEFDNYHLFWINDDGELLYVGESNYMEPILNMAWGVINDQNANK